MPKKIAIIGAGAAGLCAGNQCFDDGHDVTIFEQTDQIGGTWVYNDDVNIHSSMYEKMQ